MCKNATVELEQTGKKGEPEAYALKIGGCGNERRNGSAYCQACSDAHRAKQ